MLTCYQDVQINSYPGRNWILTRELSRGKDVLVGDCPRAIIQDRLPLDNCSKGLVLEPFRNEFTAELFYVEFNLSNSNVAFKSCRRYKTHFVKFDWTVVCV